MSDTEERKRYKRIITLMNRLETTKYLRQIRQFADNQIGRIAPLEFDIGDTVRLNSLTRTMQGVKGIVVKCNSKKAKVRLTTKGPRKNANIGATWLIPYEAMEKVEE